ncbi:MAG: Serine/threonine kinase [Burkholderiaceae bacterium]|jgi:ergothioneine biosynthesis protein EgtB|nr:MAG: Serine/threonine kinase [Burkholderiaceae bacterium]
MPPTHPAVAQASIDSPVMRGAGRELLSLALMDARNHTLRLLSLHEQAPDAAAGAARAVADPDDGVDPPLWLAGHIAWFAEYWITRNTKRRLGPDCPPEPTRLASALPAADGWWNPQQTAPAERWSARLPDAAVTRDYMLESLEGVLELLELAADEDAALYFFRLALFHEDLRGEQLVTMAQTLGLALPIEMPAGRVVREPLGVPATRWLLGSPSGGFAFDNEREAHEVPVPEFEIDAQPVTWAQYVEFVDDGGYDRPELWRPEGWDWLQALAQSEGRRGPRYVDQIGVASGAVLQTRFGSTVRMAGNQPAMHLSWWEADAWCRWAGRRLPTEVEWEVAALTAAGRGFRWGDVHEWTAGTLRPWPGFRPGPWESYSQPWFGRARVLRGASFATRARMKHAKFRGFALPVRDDLFSGFRSCAV